MAQQEINERLERDKTSLATVSGSDEAKEDTPDLTKPLGLQPQETGEPSETINASNTDACSDKLNLYSEDEKSAGSDP